MLRKVYLAIKEELNDAAVSPEDCFASVLEDWHRDSELHSIRRVSALIWRRLHTIGHPARVAAVPATGSHPPRLLRRRWATHTWT